MSATNRRVLKEAAAAPSAPSDASELSADVDTTRATNSVPEDEYAVEQMLEDTFSAQHDTPVWDAATTEKAGSDNFYFAN